MSAPRPELELARLEAEQARARHRAALVSVTEDRVLGGLREAGIPSVGLKGARLAQDIHGDASLRWSADVDVLVDHKQLDAAVDALAPLGWAEACAPAALPPLHRSLRHRDGALPDVEVRWRVHWYETAFARTPLTEGAKRDGGPLPAPLELATLLLFYARDGFGGLRYAADLTAWWDARGADLEPLALARVGRAHPDLAPALAAAVMAAHRVVGLPESVADGLPRPGRAHIAARTANWRLDGTPDQIAADFTLVDLLLTPRGGKRAFVVRHFFPPTAAVAYDYGLEGRPLAARLRRLLHGRCVTRSLVPRWLRTLMRTVAASPPGGPA